MIPEMVSVVVLAWNRLEMTRQTVGSLLATLPEKRELIVVDNGSTDGTREWLAEEVAAGRVQAAVTLDANRGSSQGFNYGLRLVRGDLLVLTDNDYEFMPGWFKTCTKVMGAVPMMGALSPSDNRHAERQRRHARQTSEGLVEYMEEPFNIVTCAMVRIDAMRSSGLMPVYGALYGETDTLWCHALRQHQWILASLKEPLARHLDWSDRTPERVSNETEQKRIKTGKRDASLNWKFSL